LKMSDNIPNTDPGVNVSQMTEDEPSSLRLITSLGVAGLLSGLLLVGSYLYTLPMIEANKAEALQKAIFKVLPGCDSYQTLVLIDSDLTRESEGIDQKKVKEDEPLKIYAGFNKSGEFIGFAIPGSEPGFQDVIGAIFGYDGASQTVIGFEVLESRETPGLGDKIFKDMEFRANFISLETVPEIMAVKKGHKTNPNEVEAITGATISSKAVVRLLNNALQQWQEPIAKFLENENMIQAGKIE